MSYDLFVSYSRRDNREGRVTELVERIKTDYREFTGGEELCSFFDVSEIAVMDDWRHRILGALRESSLLLLVLSPAYLESPYCEWEIVEFLKYEHSRAVQGQGVTPVYFVTIPGLDGPGFEERAAAWVARVRRRNQVDLRSWHEEGAAALRQADVSARLGELKEALAGRLARLRRIAQAPGNLPAGNPRFVGRETEMEQLHEAAGLGRFGVLTAIQGMGGLGKTALAIQYAYAYADFYPGGRWYVGCAGEPSLAAALRRLDTDLGISFNDAEQRDDERAARRILAELDARARGGAAARAGEPNPPQPRALLLLDNVDAPELLQPPQSDLIGGRRWLHVIATTRLGGEEFGHDGDRQLLLAVDELPLQDAVQLIESHQPQGRFPSEEERAAAAGIAALLGGFTLAVEVVAVHLGEREGRVSCVASLARLRREGLAGFEAAAKTTRRAVSHRQKLISATLGPTLNLLSPAEMLVLAYAALLPPDTIPLPWLRRLAAEDHPEFAKDAEPGYDDPWLSLVNHLLGLRLFQTVDLAEDGRTPRLVRMHRLVAELLDRSNMETRGKRTAALYEHVGERCVFMRAKEGWAMPDARWELSPIVAFCLSHMKSQDISIPAPNDPLLLDIVNNTARCLDLLGPFTECLSLCDVALTFSIRTLGLEHPNTFRCMHDLAQARLRVGQHHAALSLFRSTLDSQERQLGELHADTLSTVNNMGVALRSNGQLEEAEILSRRALEGRRSTLGDDDEDTLESISNMAQLLTVKGDYEAANCLSITAVEGRTRVHGLGHYYTLGSLHNHSMLICYKGDTKQAIEIIKRVISGYRNILPADHRDLLTAMQDQACYLWRDGDFTAAEQCFLDALAGYERSLGLHHPDTIRTVQNLAGLFFDMGKVAESERMSRRANESLLASSDAQQLNLRTAALNAYRLSDYGLARQLLVRVLDANFEIPGTRCHLARIALVTGKDAEAREHAAAAWEQRAEAPPYVLPRILWLQAAAALLQGADPVPFFGRLKTALAADGATMQWTMDPVLAALAPRLPTEALALLTALVAALSDPPQISFLEQHSAWRDASALPLA